MRAARAARLFFLTRPIKFLIYGVVVAVPVVDAKTPYKLNYRDRHFNQIYIKENICSHSCVNKHYRIKRRENEKVGVHKTEEVRMKNGAEIKNDDLHSYKILINSNENKTVELIQNAMKSFFQDLLLQ